MDKDKLIHDLFEQYTTLKANVAAAQEELRLQLEQDTNELEAMKRQIEKTKERIIAAQTREEAAQKSIEAISKTIAANANNIDTTTLKYLNQKIAALKKNFEM